MSVTTTSPGKNRVRAATLRYLMKRLPLGTPVTIHP